MVRPLRMVLVSALVQMVPVHKVLARACRWVLVLVVLPSVGLIVVV